MATNFVVKSFFVVKGKEDDIRRFKLSSERFDELLRAIHLAYGIQSFIVKYHDDENELITIGSEPEFQEAKSAAKGSVLKVYVFPKDDKNVGPQPDKPIETKKPQDPAPQEDVVMQSAPSAPQRNNVEPLSESELKQLFNEMITTPDVQAVLPQAFSVVMESLQRGETAQTIVDTMLASFPQIREHRSMTRLVPHLPTIYPTLDTYRQELLARPQMIPFITAFGPQLVTALPMLLTYLQGMQGGQGPMGMPPFMGMGMHGGPGFPFPPFGDPSAYPPPQFPPPHMFAPSAPADSQAPEVHIGITCDGCGTSPIQGVRFKCGVCPDYDLCASCESKNLHPSDHNMLKLRAPQMPNQERGRCRGGRWGAGPWGHHHHGHGHGFWGGRHKDWKRECGNKPDGCGSRKSWWRQGDQEESELKAELIASKSLADDVPVLGGETLVKTWEVKNVGSVPWPAGTKLIFKKGDLPSTENEYEVIPCMPGQNVEISAVVHTPRAPGRYKAVFRLADKNGTFFGPKLWCDLAVAETTQRQPQYDQQLKELASMGFHNEELNVSLLQQHNGDVQKVCMFYIEQMK